MQITLSTTYRQRVTQTISRLFNVLAGGSTEEMLSSRMYREDNDIGIYLIELLFGKGHCQDSYTWEQNLLKQFCKQHSEDCYGC